jgi:Gene product 88
MKITELFEGAEPRLPGAVSGIKIMTPQQFAGVEDDQEVDEATALPAQSRELGGQEFQDYMGRIKGTDDIDKKTGQVKLDKKGIPKYTTGKTKKDKYEMPYMHRSSVIEYYDEGGKRFKEEAVIEALKQRPKKLLKQNEKMKHSNGDLEQFFNVGFAALTGVAVDEATNKLIIVNTCPGAGSCKVDCFAMKGGKVQFKAAWLSDGRILTYLLNDPNGFFNTLSSEIAKEEALGKKGGYAVTVRWHDAGDFFSPEYFDLAMKMAAQFPDVKFYAYTKMAGAALANKPPNFIINWSEGANTSQEKQVKQQDPSLATTKNSRIVPEDLFYDLLAKDAKGNLAKGPDGQWQVASPEALRELKNRLAQAYKISASSILSYDEYMAKRSKAIHDWHAKNDARVQQLLAQGAKNKDIEDLRSKEINSGVQMKYNVIVAPGEGDVSANDNNVLSTLLLRH